MTTITHFIKISFEVKNNSSKDEIDALITRLHSKLSTLIVDEFPLVQKLITVEFEE